jgi:hypothetical protein
MATEEAQKRGKKGKNGKWEVRWNSHEAQECTMLWWQRKCVRGQ